MEIWKIIVREWRRLLTIPVFYVVFFIVPLFLSFFYGYIYKLQFADNLSVAIWDEDHSELSRTLTDMLQSQPSINFTYAVNSEAELKQLILENKVMGGIHMPRDMETDVKDGKQTQIVVFSNASSLIAGKLIYKDASPVAIKGGLAVVLQKLTREGMGQEQAAALVQPIKLNSYVLSNPRYSYQIYLTPGLISVVLQMFTVMVGALMLNWENKTKTRDELMELGNYSASNIIFGKTIAFLSLSWIIFIYVNFFIFPYFNLSQPNTTVNFFILYNMLILACLGFGFLLSALFENPAVSTDFSLFFTSPAFVFSGFTFPRWSMPWYDQFYAKLLPYTHFLDGFIIGYYMDMPIRYFKSQLFILAIFIVVFFALATLVFQWRINRQYLKQHA